MTNSIIGHIDRLYRRFGNWTTFERYWFTDCFVAFDSRKVPYIGDPHLHQLKYASATDPSTWRDPSNVFGALISDKSGTLVGIGFVLHGDGTVCIDLDDVVDEHGNISPEAQQILERFPNTYAEYSLSKRGIHIWLRTSRPLPADGRRRGSVEIYQDKRYIAITMDILPNRPQDMADYTDELHELYRELFGDDDNSPPTTPDDDLSEQDIAPNAASDMDDDQLIARFLRNPECEILWHGGRLAHNHSESHADCSLAYRLMWYTNGDPQRARRLFLRSRRAQRDKVRKRPDLVDRAISAAYRYYLRFRSQQTQRKQPVKSVKQDNTQSAQRRPKMSTRSSGCNKQVTQNDVFVKWFTKCVQTVPDGVVPNDLAYQSYCDYVRRCGQKPFSMKRWGQLMDKHQVPVVRKVYNGKVTRCRVGITLVGAEDPFVKWFTNCVSIDAEGVVPNELAYQSYCDYVRSIGQTPESMSKWARRMAEHQVSVARKMFGGKLTRCRVGIKLVQLSARNACNVAKRRESKPVQTLLDRSLFELWFTECVQISRHGLVTDDRAYKHYCRYLQRLGQVPQSKALWEQWMAQKQIPIIQNFDNDKLIPCRFGMILVH